MIDEETLTRALRIAGDRYAVPADAADELRRQLAPKPPVPGRPRQTFGQWLATNRGLAIAAGIAVVGVAIAVPLAIGAPGATHATSAGADLNGQHEATAGSANAQPIASPAVAGTGKGTPGAAAGSSSSISIERQRVVKTGTVRLTTSAGRVTATMTALTSLASADGGFVQSSRSDTSTTAPTAEVTLRIPVAQFAAAVSDAGRLPQVHVSSVQTTGQDVTATYVDLSARISALHQLRSTYLTILARAKTIGATLAVEDRINDAQTQIDQLTGQRKLLANRSAMSTLTVDVTTPAGETRRPGPRRGLSAAVHTSVRRFTAGVEAIIGIIGPVLLTLLILALLTGLAVVARRLIRRGLV